MKAINKKKKKGGQFDYSMLLILGALNLTGSLPQEIRNYVENGGTLVWSVGNARPEHLDLIGGNLTGQLFVGRAARSPNVLPPLLSAVHIP